MVMKKAAGLDSDDALGDGVSSTASMHRSYSSTKRIHSALAVLVAACVAPIQGHLSSMDHLVFRLQVGVKYGLHSRIGLNKGNNVVLMSNHGQQD